MCGRYTNTVQIKKLAERFGFKSPNIVLPRRFNIAPGQDCPVVIIEDGEKNLKLLPWGLIPFWVKDLKVAKNQMINARAETVDKKPSFKRPFQSQRCLVLADGFYEWKQIPGKKKKQPYRITFKNEEPFALAGLFEKWEKEGQMPIHSFTIVTTSANDKLKSIHDRMPVILRSEDEGLWVDPDLKDQTKLKRLLKPYSEEEFSYYPVSELVNSPRNETEECIRPLSDNK